MSSSSSQSSAGAPAVMDIRSIARAVGGEILRSSRTHRLYVAAPGPGHSANDRSLTISLCTTSNKLIVHSFAGDDWRACQDYVCDRLGIPRWHPGKDNSERTHRNPNDRRHGPRKTANDGDPADFALRLWNEARDPRGTIVERYLASRGLDLLEQHSGTAIKFHPALKLNGARVGGMLCLFRDIETNEPCGIHRTFLDREGRKIERKMLGRARNAAIKLDADEDVTLGLYVGEGVETSIAAQLAGFRPVWALGSATAIARFPVLSGVEAINILGEVEDSGTNDRAAKDCAARWTESGREAFIVKPLIGGDLNDVWREVA